MFPIRRDQIAKIHLLALFTHPLLTSKDFSLEGLTSDRVSLHVQLPSIHMEVTTEGLVAFFANMEFDTLGSAKLEFLDDPLLNFIFKQV